MYFVRQKNVRRTLGAALVVTGGLLMWLSPEAWLGALMFATEIALEAIGIWLEHSQDR